MSETDSEFLDRIEDFFDDYSGIPKEVVDRLFALARRGAEAAARIEAVEDENVTLTQALCDEQECVVRLNSVNNALKAQVATMIDNAGKVANLRAKLERLCDAAQAVIRVADRATVEFDGLRAAIASAHTADEPAHSAFEKGNAMTINIPPEAVEAVAAHLYALEELDYHLVPWADTSDLTKDIYRDHATAAIRAALKAWPGNTATNEFNHLLVMRPALILPLNTENPDAEA